MRVRKLGVVAVVAAAIPVAGAHAATPATTVKGVVVAREQARGALVVAGTHGTVSTLRTSVLRAAGTKVTARATRLSDGTYRATAVSVAGSARTALVHAVVVAVRPTQLVLAAGTSTFAVFRGRRLASAAAGRDDVKPGDVVNTSVSIGDNGQLSESTVDVVGTADLVRLEGTLSSVSSSQIVLAVHNGAITTIGIPPSLTLPTSIVSGDEVQVIAQYGAGAFTLVAIEDDHQAAQSGSSGGSGDDDQGDDDNGGGGEHGQGASGASGASSTTGGNTGLGALDLNSVLVEGTVTANTDHTLTVQPGTGAATTFTRPAGSDLGVHLTVGQRILIKGEKQSDGTVVIVTFRILDGSSGSTGSGSTPPVNPSPTVVSSVTANGSVTAVSATSLSVETDGGVRTFTVPASIDTSALKVGDHVHAEGTKQSDGSLLLQVVQKTN